MRGGTSRRVWEHLAAARLSGGDGWGAKSRDMARANWLVDFGHTIAHAGRPWQANFLSLRRGLGCLAAAVRWRSVDPAHPFPTCRWLLLACPYPVSPTEDIERTHSWEERPARPITCVPDAPRRGCVDARVPPRPARPQGTRGLPPCSINRVTPSVARIRVAIRFGVPVPMPRG